MASQVLSPETPPESDECCLLKLPLELRVVIYQMAFEGLCFDGEERLEEMTRDRMAKMQGDWANGDATAEEQGLAWITENGDGAEEDEEDDADGATNEEEHEYTHGEDKIEYKDNTQDEGDAVNIEDDEIGDEEVNISNGEGETRDEHEGTEEDNHYQEEGIETEEGDHAEVSCNSDPENDDGDDSEASSPGAEDEPRDDLHITRPPLLATCQQIRQEAIPVYSNALTVLTTKILTDANDTISGSKKLIDEGGNELGYLRGLIVSMLKLKLLNMGYVSKDRVFSIAEEVVSIEASVGGSVVRSKQTKDPLVEATTEFRKLIFNVAGVDLGEESA